ncbi:family 43 glycosylhydrolase [Amycolatopsis acidicola]|uniref:Family 43 glycosylhydrolase n=1 Tax=Amycolatopsis acidicola TaxID=2596893 RepID=A0A5N0URA8_9PSEU|nr:glycoside hydrolase family 43 protein [Amycolatopsis acidicola]KAA9151622.1 family 43 glycosylhydrolase [Amycolatopsis acidicola]
MTKRSLRALTTLAAALLSVAGTPAEAATAPKVLINQDFPDPGVVAGDAGYYAFSTAGSSGRVQLAQSNGSDGGWSMHGDALTGPPSWASSSGEYWAPDVSRSPDGSYLMYLSAHTASTGQMCLGTATSRTPGGPFQPDSPAPLVCVGADRSDIDPQSFMDTNGKRYLLYKSDADPDTIWLQEVTPDGHGLRGDRVPLIQADRPEEHGVVEAPSLVRNGSQYVLCYSGDYFKSSGYHTGYATASNIGGPYTKSATPLLTTESLGGAVDGPGGADVVGGHIFFHGWLDKDHNARGMYSLPIRFSDGKPVVG